MDEAEDMSGVSDGMPAEPETPIDTIGRLPLTGREKACLQLLANGDRAIKIADKLGLATVTVEMHLRNARMKLGAKTLWAAVANAIRTKQID